jgi:hypothetical protein
MIIPPIPKLVFPTLCTRCSDMIALGDQYLFRVFPTEVEMSPITYNKTYKTPTELICGKCITILGIPPLEGQARK